MKKITNTIALGLIVSSTILCAQSFPADGARTRIDPTRGNDKMQIANQLPVGMGQPSSFNAIVIPAPQPFSLKAKFDSIYQWTWDSIAMHWTIYGKQINFVYDASQNMLSDISQTWNGTAWVNLNQNNYTYNAGNKETGLLTKR